MVKVTDGRGDGHIEHPNGDSFNVIDDYLFVYDCEGERIAVYKDTEWVAAARGDEIEMTPAGDVKRVG